MMNGEWWNDCFVCMYVCGNNMKCHGQGQRLKKRKIKTSHQTHDRARKHALTHTDSHTHTRINVKWTEANGTYKQIQYIIQFRALSPSLSHSHSRNRGEQKNWRTHICMVEKRKRQNSGTSTSTANCVRVYCYADRSARSTFFPLYKCTCVVEMLNIGVSKRASERAQQWAVAFTAISPFIWNTFKLLLCIGLVLLLLPLLLLLYCFCCCSCCFFLRLSVAQYLFFHSHGNGYCLSLVVVAYTHIKRRGYKTHL